MHPKPSPPRERMIVYVDGFNLYHGMHERFGRKYLWLDLVKLARSFRPKQELVMVKYFTASVLDNPEGQARQEIKRCRRVESWSRVASDKRVRDPLPPQVDSWLPRLKRERLRALEAPGAVRISSVRVACELARLEA